VADAATVAVEWLLALMDGKGSMLLKKSLNDSCQIFLAF